MSTIVLLAALSGPAVPGWGPFWGGVCGPGEEFPYFGGCACNPCHTCCCEVKFDCLCPPQPCCPVFDICPPYPRFCICPPRVTYCCPTPCCRPCCMPCYSPCAA